jgi:hypothetical protein
MEIFYFITIALFDKKNIKIEIDKDNNNFLDVFKYLHEDMLTQKQKIVRSMIMNSTLIYYTQHTNSMRALYSSTPSPYKNKFDFLYKNLNNIFLDEECKEDFLNIFCKIQKVYNGFSRFAYLYRLKKAKVQVDSDLYMNVLNENSKNVFVLYQNKNKYFFAIHDLMKIIKNSICNSEYFYSKSMTCKNPYNNIVFNKSSLYNIYFFMRFKSYIIPDYFQLFFLANFDISLFERENEYMIREYSVDNYLNSKSRNCLYKDVNAMISYYNNRYAIPNRKIKYSQEIPKETIIETFLPYLRLFLLSKYCIGVERQDNKHNELIYKLEKFAEFNPNFGRKIKIMKKVFYNKINYEDTFNMKQIPYKVYTDDNFMTSHDTENTNNRYSYEITALRIPAYSEEEQNEEVFSNETSSEISMEDAIPDLPGSVDIELGIVGPMDPIESELDDIEDPIFPRNLFPISEQSFYNNTNNSL